MIEANQRKFYRRIFKYYELQARPGTCVVCNSPHVDAALGVWFCPNCNTVAHYFVSWELGHLSEAFRGKLARKVETVIGQMQVIDQDELSYFVGTFWNESDPEPSDKKLVKKLLKFQEKRYDQEEADKKRRWKKERKKRERKAKKK